MDHDVQLLLVANVLDPLLQMSTFPDGPILCVELERRGFRVQGGAAEFNKWLQSRSTFSKPTILGAGLLNNFGGYRSPKPYIIPT